MAPPVDLVLHQSVVSIKAKVSQYQILASTQYDLKQTLPFISAKLAVTVIQKAHCELFPSTHTSESATACYISYQALEL